MNAPLPTDDDGGLWDGEGPMPTARRFASPPYPRLSQIARELWADVLAPCPRARRSDAILDHEVIHLHDELLALVESLPPPPDEIADRAITSGGARIPAPEAGRAPAPQTRQVNVRLSRPDHQDLCVAAEIAGTTPTTLARMLILNGARRMVAEHGGAYAAARSRGAR
jgi:hypothetical protein